MKSDSFFVVANVWMAAAWLTAPDRALLSIVCGVLSIVFFLMCIACMCGIGKETSK